MCSAHQKTGTCFWHIRKIRKYSSYFPKCLTYWVGDPVTSLSPFRSCKWNCLSLHMSGPRMRRKGQVDQRLSCLLSSTIQKWDHGKSTDTVASIWVKKVGFLDWFTIIVSILGILLLPKGKCCFFWGSCLKWSVFKEWASALLPRSGWASCCCSENRQIYTLVDLKAEKVTVNTGTFLLSSLINHSMGFTSPVS